MHEITQADDGIAGNSSGSVDSWSILWRSCIAHTHLHIPTIFFPIRSSCMTGDFSSVFSTLVNMTPRPNLLFLRLSGLNSTAFMDGTGFRIQEMRRPRWWVRIQGGTLRHTMHALIVAGSLASRLFTYECRRVSGQGMAESKRIPRSMSGSVLMSPVCGFGLT